MGSALRFLWSRHRLALLAFALVTVVTLGLGARMVVFGLYWADPAHRDQEIAGWMTPRYVGRSWGLPPEKVAAALGLPGEPGKRITLDEIAAERGLPLPALVQQLEDAIAAHRAGQ